MTDFDVIIIGSGAGGLTAAAALAQAGYKVLVLEQHYLPGGWCHSFSIRGYRFSPGVHYIGELSQGGLMRQIYEGLGLGQDLHFYELNPDAIDHIIIGDERFDIPRGKDKLRHRLQSRFPKEADGITNYIDTVHSLSEELATMIDLASIADIIKIPFKAPHIFRWSISSGAKLINSYATDPLLRAILGSQSGDYGLAPSMCSALLHASIVAHYFNGGFYPKGGAHALPRAYIRALHRDGGKIETRSRVSKIVIEGGRAIGVRLVDGREIRGKNIISNADPQVTYGELVGLEHLPWLTRINLSRQKWSASALSLFMVVDMDLKAHGLDSGNYWYYQNSNIENIYRQGLSSSSRFENEFPLLFLTCTTLKDPSKDYKGKHTIEAFTAASYDTFLAWKESKEGLRPESYTAFKNQLKTQMIATVEKIIPQISQHIIFAELGTPLTNEYYCSSTRGSIYGTAKTSFQTGPFSYLPRTPINNLFLCGASTIGHGVFGASLSGLATAAAIARCQIKDLLKSGQPEITLEQRP